ncbi:MAG: PQQ-binding-like beta-propeller repeat protein [Planctomycetota bacterium]
MTTVTAWLAALPLLALPAATRPTGDDPHWPRFRGPAGAGLSTDEAPEDFTDEDYNWRVELPGRGHSSPVVWGKRIFVTGSTRTGRRVLACLSTEDGSELWTDEAKLTTVRMHDLNSNASASPAVDASRVVVAWRDGGSRRVVALDHEGTRLWERTIEPFTAGHGATSSPVLVDGVVVLAHDNEAESGMSFLTGLNAETGETIWTRERQTTKRRAAYATPAVRTTADGTREVLFASTAHGLTALDPKTGDVRWEVGELFTTRCVSSPLVVEGENHNDLVFATAGTGGGGKESAAIALSADAEPKVLYRLRRGLPYVPTPVAYGGHLFLWADGGTVACVRLSDGEELWRERVDGTFYGSPICAGGRLYAMNTSGELVVLSAAAQHDELARIDLGEASQATPAAVGGVLYLRTEGHLISVGGELF